MGKSILKAAVVAGLVLISSIALSAATITPTTSDLVLTVLSLDVDNSIVGFDLRGTATGIVDGSAPNLGTVFVTDGQPLGFPPPAFPNGILILINQALLESGLLGFATPALGGFGLEQTAAFFPLTPITDPAMAEFVNFPPLIFHWSFTSSIPGEAPGTTLSSWQLVNATSSSAIPEPASFALMGLGLTAVAVARKRRR